MVDDSAAVDTESSRTRATPVATGSCSPTTCPSTSSARDELIERFEVRHHGGTTGAVPADEDDEDVEEDELEPDEDVDEL